MEVNIDLSVMYEMLLTIESRLSALIEFEIGSEKMNLFNEATQKHRELILKQLQEAYPSIEIVRKE